MIEIESKLVFITPILFQIYSLILQGRVNDVRELLAQHPDKQSGEYDVSVTFEKLPNRDDAKKKYIKKKLPS